jgi:hypothetical protein
MTVVCLACRRDLDTEQPSTLRCPCGSRAFAWDDHAEKPRTNYTPTVWNGRAVVA